MAQKKKLQVFVSSTYTDLREERQAAVEAILTAGHIPAGMELFTAGDESQMNVIKRWIDESDVYLLILGGRYGSLEPRSQKSYIHLEYEYAVEKGKPFFAVVIDEDYAKERVKIHPLGVDVFETENAQKLKEFREQIVSKVVRFWRDSKDIKLAVLEKMAEFARRDDLIGWIPGNEAVNTGAIAEEIARLGNENADLRERLTNSSQSLMRYHGLTFEELYKLLAGTSVDVPEFDERLSTMLRNVAKSFGDTEPGLLHLIWQLRERLSNAVWIGGYPPYLQQAILKAEEFGLVEVKGSSHYILTETGKRFLLRLRIERDTEKADTFAM